jgi:Raf kinase inhibitor-like YbhB/YbcL family protein
MRWHFASVMSSFRNLAPSLAGMRPRNFLVAGFIVSFTVSILPISGIAADVSKFQIKSPILGNESTIPPQFTCSGANQSPPLSWSAVPTGTKSLVLLMEDPDAPDGIFVHWIVYDISPNSGGFNAGAHEGKAGVNSAGQANYQGPCPPPGKPHHYHFKLYALDTDLNLKENPDAQTMQNAMQGHVKESTELVGIFGR